MSWKDKAWKYATIIIVALIILNPELAELALFIDAIGLEMFFMLMEVQILVALGFILSKAKAISSYVYHFLNLHIPINMWKSIKKDPQNFVFFIPNQTTILHSVVVFMAFGIACELSLNLI